MSITAALQGLSIAQRIGGAAIVLCLWLAPPVGVWLYMRGQLGSAQDLGRAQAAQACAERSAESLAKAITEARDAWREAQTDIDKAATRDARRIADQLDTVRRHTERLTRDITDYAAANPLPAGCRADPERVRLYNDARRTPAP